MRRVNLYQCVFKPTPEIKLEGGGGSTCAGVESQRVGWWQTLATLVTPSIQDVVEFAKRIPGFLEFAQDDQLILIKLGFFEVWLVHVSRSVLPDDEASRGAVTFADGTYVSHDQLDFIFDVSLIDKFGVLLCWERVILFIHFYFIDFHMRRLDAKMCKSFVYTTVQ